MDLVLVAFPVLRGEGEDGEELDAEIRTPKDELPQLLSPST